MPNPRESAVKAVVETHGLHGAIHALIEVCYRTAADLDRGDPHGRPTENWKLIARLLTAVEAEAARLDLRCF